MGHQPAADRLCLLPLLIQDAGNRLHAAVDQGLLPLLVQDAGVQVHAAADQGLLPLLNLLAGAVGVQERCLRTLR